ncbi:MAG TPA: HD-GYP domain-containing protein [Burkholderiales bacterium]|nr:HD-GYP domain-containing protein [Burkholderiales bacterium]
MKAKRVAVADLRVGMYVTELDRPWIGTPFAFQGFAITSPEQLQQLRGCCKWVMVDEEGAPAASAPGKDTTGPLILRGTTHYKAPSAPVEVEVPRAKTVYAACEAVVNDMTSRLRFDGVVDARHLKSSVNEITESVVRNPDAMMLLAKMRKKGQYEFDRAVSTSVLMIAFGRFLQLTREQLDILGMAGILLDVGKTRIPDAVLYKKQVLTPQEYDEAKNHVKHSAELISESSDFFRQVREVVLQHHERQDGSGYPRGLRGAEISIYGAIAGIVDSYSAMISARPYAEQLSPSNALGELHRLRGKLFHEALVEQFIQCIGIYPVGSIVELNTGEIGIVIAQNLVRRLQPRVMVVLDAERRPLRPQKVLDLLKEPKASAGEPYRIRRTMRADALPMDPAEYFL